MKKCVNIILMFVYQNTIIIQAVISPHDFDVFQPAISCKAILSSTLSVGPELLACPCNLLTRESARSQGSKMLADFLSICSAGLLRMCERSFPPLPSMARDLKWLFPLCSGPSDHFKRNQFRQNSMLDNCEIGRVSRLHVINLLSKCAWKQSIYIFISFEGWPRR